MNIFHEILKKNKAAIENCVEGCTVEQECESFFKDADLFLKTGNIDYLKFLNDIEENIVPVPSKSTGRKKKPLSTNIHTSNTLEVDNINIKKEKLSDIQEVTQAHDDVVTTTQLPQRKKKTKTEQTDLPARCTRAQTRKLETIVSSGSKSIRSPKIPDIIFENVVIPTIEVSDNARETDLDVEKIENLGSVRNTRSTIKKRNKLVENCVQEPQVKDLFLLDEATCKSTGAKPKQKKTPPSTEPRQLQFSSGINREDECRGTVHTEKIRSADTTYTVFEDSHGDNKNLTSLLNSTVIIDNPKIISKELQQVQDQKLRGIKEEPTTPPACSKKAKEQIFTPAEYLDEACAYALPIKKTGTSRSSAKSAALSSALKASKAQFREMDKRKQEKETEALKKKEALLQKQTEERKRKMKEKQEKARHQREIQEKVSKIQKLKEIKLKQAMKDKEEKLQKIKKEAERKAEQAKSAKMKHGEFSGAKQASAPIYMTTKPLLLPTDDCYDSDDQEYEARSEVVPSWCTSKKDKELQTMQMVMISAGETVKNSFFCLQAQTPDLQDIFEMIDPRKLKRTSSAIWRKPPRYTLMPVLEDTKEDSENSD